MHKETSVLLVLNMEVNGDCMLCQFERHICKRKAKYGN